MVSGFAVAGAVLGMEKLVTQATNGAKFLKRHMFDVSSGRLKRTCYAGTGGTVEQRWGRGSGQTLDDSSPVLQLTDESLPYILDTLGRTDSFWEMG